MTPEEMNAANTWNQVKSQSLAGLVAGLGAGAGVRGLLGLFQGARQNLTQPSRNELAPQDMEIPVSLPEEDERVKRASKLTQLFSDYVGQPATNLYNNAMSGGKATSTLNHPLGIPMVVGGMAGGAYGGWQLVDYMLEKRRKQNLDDEMAAAKKDYEDTLMGKTAEAAEMIQSLDAVYDRLMEKRALPDPANVLGTSAGLYALYALVAGTAGAGVGYDWAKKRQSGEVLDAARKRQMRSLLASQPATPVAIPSQF